jgi:tetratricopeptide (TPR) repeat protein
MPWLPTMNTIDLMYDRARWETKQLHFSIAADLYRQIIDKLPFGRARVPFHLLAAEANLDAGREREAIDDCHAAIAIDSHSSLAWRTLGRILLEGGKLVDAERSLQKCIAIEPSRSAYIYLAIISLNANRIEEAESFCRQAIAMDSEFAEAYLNLAQALNLQNRKREAIDALQIAIEKDSNSANAHRVLGELLFESGKGREALQHILRAAEIAPHDVRLRVLIQRLEGDRHK